jgi:hypothetical protein
MARGAHFIAPLALELQQLLLANAPLVLLGCSRRIAHQQPDRYTNGVEQAVTSQLGVLLRQLLQSHALLLDLGFFASAQSCPGATANSGQRRRGSGGR